MHQIRRMRGGAQGHLMLGGDGNAYVVKFQNNPQHIRVLANELMATKLAMAVGLPVPEYEVIEVSRWLVDNTPELDFDLGPRRERCQAGLCFGSRFVGGLMPGHCMDLLPEEELIAVKNLEAFAGILAFDKWTCNSDGRQAVYTKKPREKHYAATFIDFGYCFNAGEWVFRDSPLTGVCGRKAVYTRVTGMQSLEPWLGRIEQLSPEVIWEAAQAVPPEWYGGQTLAIELLTEHLVRRQPRVRELVEAFRTSSRAPFPNWGKPSA